MSVKRSESVVNSRSYFNSRKKQSYWYIHEKLLSNVFMNNNLLNITVHAPVHDLKCGLLKESTL